MPGIRSLKSSHLIELDDGKPLMASISEKFEKLGLYIQPRLEFTNIKARLESGIFRCVSLLNGAFFRVMIQDFLIEEVVPYVMSLRSFPIPNSTT
jgi:hypothetical protein